MSVKKKNLDVYLEEVFKQYIAIKDDDFSRAQEVFKSVFEQIKLKMGEQCNYFKKYSSQVMYGGSVYDGTKTTKMDEFDMDIVIRLPINYEDIIMEGDQPGFVWLKIVGAFDNLDKQKEWEQCHKVTRDWRDGDKYFLQNKFRSWMHGIVQKAINDMDGRVTVNGTTYLLKYKESGPAYTLYIRNVENGEQFQLDVDLVPVIRFMLPRWPKGYRTTNKVRASCRDWLVVPKPNKAASGAARARSWRLSFQDHERDLLKDFHHLKKVLRLMKKLRTALKLKDIASYYIKTLFLWRVEKEDKQFWQNKLSFLFGAMLQDFHDALERGNIPYFWNGENNLIETLKPTNRKLYANKLKEVLDSVQANNVDKTIFALLEVDEIEQFKSSEMYQRHSCLSPAPAPAPGATQAKDSRSSSVTSSTSGAERGNSPTNTTEGRAILKNILNKLDLILQQLDVHEDRLSKLETAYELYKRESEKESDETKTVQAQVDTSNVENINEPPEIDSEALILF